MNRLKQFLDTYLGQDVEWRMKTCRIILFFVVAASTVVSVLFATVFRSWRLADMPALLFSLSILAICLITFYLTLKLKNGTLVYCIILGCLNFGILPFFFFRNQGTAAVTLLWMLLGMFLNFMLLDKIWLIVFWMANIVTDICIFYVAAGMGGGVSPNTLANRCVTLILIATTLGVVMKNQMDRLEREKRLSDQKSREIEEISESKSLFFANMSHEIRTPINTIIGLNEMILREDVSDEIAENAVNIQNASKILLALINDILDLSKMESGKMEIVPSQYETAAMFSDLVNIIWVRANQKKLEFKIDIDEDIPSMLYGDEVRIKQVLTNILTNAVKYTETGSVTLTVKGERLDNNLVRLRMAVEDTGIGIKKENLDELFTVFRRVDQQRTNKIEGTGLGLALAKQLVDRMGGTIAVDSIYQRGSCFTVTIDQQIVDEAPLGSLKYAAKRGVANREKYDRSFEAPDARILVVDDNEMNLMVAKKLLRDTKVQVDLAVCGQECLEKTKENSYHVILMDHMMPGMDGEETLKILRGRQDGFCQDTPVIALTANVMANANEWYQNKGFDGYLAKPISGALLEAALRRFLPEDLVEYSAVEAEETEYTSMSFHRKKKKICICTECVCDLPREWIRAHDIKMVYCYVVTEKGRFADMREVGSSELMKYIATGKIARTECASQEEYEMFFADRLMEAERVIFLTLPPGIRSDDYVTAMRAAKNFDNVTVVNSGHVSAGLGLLVMRAVEMAESGASEREILEELSKNREKISSSFILKSVDSMYVNGQIGKKLWQISRALQLHPVLGMSRGKFAVQGVQTGNMTQAARRYIRWQLRHSKKIDGRFLIIAYVGLNKKQLEEIRREVLKHMSFDAIWFQKAAAGISSNCGMGAFGLFYVRK